MVLWSVSSFGILCSIEWNCHLMPYKISKSPDLIDITVEASNHAGRSLCLNKKSIMRIKAWSPKYSYCSDTPLKWILTFPSSCQFKEAYSNNSVFHKNIYSESCLSWPPTVPEKVVNISKWSTYTNVYQNNFHTCILFPANYLLMHTETAQHINGDSYGQKKY